jgi:hypothetical protein
MWDSHHVTTLQDCTVFYGDSFTFTSTTRLGSTRRGFDVTIVPDSCDEITFTVQSRKPREQNPWYF